MAKHPHEDQRNSTEDIEAEDIVVTEEQIARAVNLARDQYRIVKKIEGLEKELKELNAELDRNKTVELPTAMKDAALTELPLKDGYKIKMEKIVKASIPSPENKKVADAKERNERGISYMDKAAPDLVVTKLTIVFQRGEFKELRRFLGDNKRRKKPLEMELTRTVHGGTLSKWVRERDAAALPVDEEAIQVYRVDVAELIAPKAPKAL